MTDDLVAWLREQVASDERMAQARRRIIDLHAEAPVSVNHCGECLDEWPCLTLRLLALSHASHPGYRAEWAPDEETTT